ncbi:unnamed protein product [Heligmosomoides polygyrus]|uniref:Endo/exonuclease/phosphatase domain-containing protein n=1 Tax=Heligmosomoides polygyrus TaxID=6339 RepID=A0A183G646_HELPZ|nr:unnamed protein product [Heligmosomoides polygyrus]
MRAEADEGARLANLCSTRMGRAQQMCKERADAVMAIDSFLRNTSDMERKIRDLNKQVDLIRQQTRSASSIINMEPSAALVLNTSVEDLMMQARKIKYDVIGLTETRRHHPLHAAYDSGEELFLGTCDSRGVGGVGVLVNTHLAMNIDSYESLTTRIGRLRLKRCGSVPALTVFVAYAPTSDYDDEEVEAFYVELEKFYKGDHTFYKVIVGDSNAKIGSRSYVYLGRGVNMANDLAPELSRRKRAAWGAFKSVEEVAKKTRNVRLCPPIRLHCSSCPNIRLRDLCYTKAG